MYKYLLLIAIAVGSGCQTPTAPAKKVKLETGAEVLVLKAVETGFGYEVEAILYEPEQGDPVEALSGDEEASFPALRRGSEIRGNVLTAPRVSVRPNDWGVIKVSQDIRGYSATAAYMVDGEMIEVPASAGINVTLKASPGENNTVWIKGVMALSRFDENGRHQFRIFPLDVNFPLNEYVEVYRVQTEFDKSTFYR